MPAVCYCEQCRGYLCQACFDWHCSKTSYMAHRTTDVTAENNQEANTLKCLEHTQNVVYICLQCDRLLCATCIAHYCLDHEIKDVNVVLKVRKDEVKKMITRFQEQMSTMMNQEIKLQAAKEKNDGIFKESENTIRTQAQDILTKVQQNGGKALEDLYSLHDKLQKDIALEQRSQDVQGQLLQNLERAARAISQPGKEMLLLMTYPMINARAPQNTNAAVAAQLEASQVQFIPKSGVEIGSIQVTKGKKRPTITPRRHIASRLSSNKADTVRSSRSPRSPRQQTDVQIEDVANLSSNLEQKWIRKGLGLEYGWDVAFVPRGIAVSDHSQFNCKVQLRSLVGTLEGDTQKHGVEMSEPCGLTYSEHLGYLLVAEPYLGCVQALDPNKLSLKKSIPLTHANHPTGLGSMRSGHLVVTEAGSRTGISIHDTHGSCVKSWASWTREDQQFDKPYYICTDQHDRIIVSDMGNHCVKIFDNTGKLLLKFGQTADLESFKRPGGICVTPENNILVVHCYHGNYNRVSVFSPDGQLMGKLLDLDKGQGELRSAAYENGILALVSEKAVYTYKLSAGI